MKVALIYPPYRHKVFSENLPVVNQEFCHAPPIILAYVASIIRQAGHEVILIDACINSYSKEKALQILKMFNPDLLGFRLESYYFFDTLDWIRFFKKELNVPVVAGGVNVTLYPSETFLHKEIDYGITGDAIESLPNLIRNLETGQDARGISGVIYRENGNIRVNPAAESPVDFDRYPFPARDLLPNEKYSSFLSKRKNFTIMVTSRGCTYNCNFCAICRIPYQERSAQSVIEEIEECYRRHNVREIDFFDATFFINRKRFFEIAGEIRKRKLKIEWSCRTRVDLVDEEILKEASEAGCTKILLGIESADERILANIKKGINIEQTKRAVKLCKRYGISTLGFIMVGNPGESLNSAQQTVRFTKELELDFVQVCRAIAKPNTYFNDLVKEKYGRDFWSEYISGKIDENSFPELPGQLSKSQAKKAVQKAYLVFYFRPQQILRALSKVRSASEMMKYILVGLKMLLFNREAK